MTADAWSIYDSFREYEGDGTIDMDDDEFYMALFLSTSNCDDDTVGDEYGDLTNEVANQYGYTTGGEHITNTITNANQWLRSGASVKFDTDNPVWTATSGSITGVTFAVIYDTTPAATPTDPLVCWTALDNTSGATPIPDITDTNTLTVTIDSSGVLTVSGG